MSVQGSPCAESGHLAAFAFHLTRRVRWNNGACVARLARIPWIATGKAYDFRSPAPLSRRPGAPRLRFFCRPLARKCALEAG